MKKAAAWLSRYEKFLTEKLIRRTCQAGPEGGFRPRTKASAR